MRLSGNSKVDSEKLRTALHEERSGPSRLCVSSTQDTKDEGKHSPHHLGEDGGKEMSNSLKEGYTTLTGSQRQPQNENYRAKTSGNTEGKSCCLLKNTKNGMERWLSG